MKNISIKLSVIFISLVIFVPIITFAHQPRITKSTDTITVDTAMFFQNQLLKIQNGKLVDNPEISKAYYGELVGKPQIYTFSTKDPFNLYVNILVPYTLEQKKNVSFVVIKDNNYNYPLMVSNSTNFEWKKYFEPFGHDWYWMGPEYKVHAEAGEYQIWIGTDDGSNQGKYTLAIGEKEAFNLKEAINAVKLIPDLKKNFFNKSPIDFILSPIGFGYIIVMYAFSFILGFVYRFLMKKYSKNSIHGVAKNINKHDKLVRFLLGLILLLWAITTSWSPLLLFFSGFCFFEAIFSWCGFYAAIGKSTCPIE